MERCFVLSEHLQNFSQQFSILRPIAEDIAADVELDSEVTVCTDRKRAYIALPMNALLNDYATGDYDFNDQVITEICKNNGFTLITNDSDFKTQEIPILTANAKLL